jgi:hypothetical protein
MACWERSGKPWWTWIKSLGPRPFYGWKVNKQNHGDSGICVAFWNLNLPQWSRIQMKHSNQIDYIRSIIVGSQEMKLFGDREEERFVHFSNHQF